MWSMSKSPYGVKKKTQRFFSVYLVSQITNRLEAISPENETYSKKAAQFLACNYEHYIKKNQTINPVFEYINPLFNPFLEEFYDPEVDVPTVTLPNKDRLAFVAQTKGANILQDNRKIPLLILVAPNESALSALVYNFNQNYRGNSFFSRKIDGDIDDLQFNFLYPLDMMSINQLHVKQLCDNIQSKVDSIFTS